MVETLLCQNIYSEAVSREANATRGVSIQFVEDHTKLLQLALKQAYLCFIDMKFTLVIVFGLNFALI